MKTASAGLIALLAGSNQFLMADLVTITLKSTYVIRITSADVDIVSDGHVFSPGGRYTNSGGSVIAGGGRLLMQRGRLRTTKGLEVDTLDMTIFADPTNLMPLIDFINGETFIDAARNGVLDGATVRLERAFLSSWDAAPVGTLVLFSGRVAEIQCSRTAVLMAINSDLELLNIKMPRNIYQPACANTVYDSACGAIKAAFTISGTVEAVNGTRSWFQGGGSGVPDGFFAQGVVTFFGGTNNLISRTVKAHAGLSVRQFQLIEPLPREPQIGDSFSAVAGCDRTAATCAAKFGNLARFRGHPHIPIPEKAL
ncbi:MAG: hypothetical protein AW11_03418 [Candidatus Accumulibacter regalis]|jgi:uncharacterized phage protein (TIGR02218 family)|uniref:Bacteriophage phiJL001 Gp84 C-terminal domain-containing protein n=1 Tax=Accumulibacter regalis TaxID=522306 RepID=A0A011Q8W9_ACCRE|nr:MULTISPECIES: DUF2163 domain-containing protein [unclassified Candidatus Accumulibacter]EXI85590.1 MAG: hypothetical protein AW11_03418 [Candidatus Accumulibacter regalis]MBN8513543.1 DUF2163 domain-containing protein [Accumulibacter sp.]MBO3701807.1 DUF2163 domain-containing protein [Accumulibacter sp.]HRE72612.1 DUF2163 domain-containing protein [Accumulibacter sp.]